MTGQLYTGAPRATDANGKVIPGAKMYFYATGTNTFQTVYADAAQTTALSNPVLADAGGRYPSVYLNATMAYRAYETDFLGAPTGLDIDPYSQGLSINDGASGSLFTTIQGFVNYLLSSAGSSIISFIQAGTGAVARSMQAKAREVVSVLDFGADLTGTTDSAAAFQAAVNYVGSAGGGTVFVPAGTYRMNSTLRTSAVSAVAADGHACVVKYSNVKIRGDGIGKTNILHRAYGGGSMQTNWQTVGGAVWRGNCFYIYPQGGTTLTGFGISDLTINGGFAPTGNSTIPANVTTGDGWDQTFHAIALANNLLFDKTVIERFEGCFYSGEIVQGAGLGLGLVRAYDNILHDTNGDCWSIQAQHQFCRNYLYNAYGNGIDSCQGGFGNMPSLYDGNIIYNCYIGINNAWLTGYVNIGQCTVTNNTMQLCAGAGITVSGVSGSVITGNRVIDCGSANVQFAVQFATTASFAINNIKFSDNIIQYNTISNTNGNGCVVFVDSFSTGYAGITAMGNIVELTAQGVAAGKTITSGYNFGGITDPKSVIRNNQSKGTTFSATDGSQIVELLLTTTASTLITSVGPPRPNTVYRVSGYGRVVTGSTNVTLTVTWNDAGGAQTNTQIVNTVAAGGNAQFTPVTFTATGTAGALVRVKGMTSVANQAYMSVVIEQIA